MKQVILSLVIVIILTGCNGSLNGTLRQPEGNVIVGGEHYTMTQSNYEWQEDDVEIEQERSNDINELADYFKTLDVKKGDTLKFEIDKNPSSITVTKLNEDGTIDSVEIKDNKIIMPSKEGYYIYELNATWDKGKVTFVFDINVK